MKLPTILGAAMIALVLFPGCKSAKKVSPGYVQENYTKREVYIPMRDGTKLYTAIYTPKGATEKYPILLMRTPYSCSPYGNNNYPAQLGTNESLMKEKYIYVYQDVRGRYKSEGQFREMTPANDHKQTKNDTDESSDTYDTVDWLVTNTLNNGRVGIYGISYPGFYASAALPDAHPAIKAVSPQAPVTDEFVGDDCNHNGAFFLLDNFDFYNYFDGKRSADSQDYQPVFKTDYSDAYQFFLGMGGLNNANTNAYFHDPSMIWRQAVDHDTYDSFWQARNIRPHLKKIKPAVLVVGGWYDAEDLFGALRTYEAIETQTPGNNNRLVMGPWTHGAWAKKSWTDFGGYAFGSNVNQYYKDSIETRFFNYYLKDKGSFSLPEATVFETGSNQWKTYNSWPVANAVATTYYFQPGRKLSTQKPGIATSFDSYISDPANPVPYTDSVHEERNNAYMIEDQRFAARRPDVLLFESDTLLQDLTVTGRLKASLYVSTTGTDADFIVKLIDEYPNGVQRMVRAEVFRGKFRHSYEKPEAFDPGKIEHIAFDLNEITHSFKKGHRITVQVQSSWFPLVDRNPQKFMKIPDAQEQDFQKASIRVYHDAKNCSSIVLPILQ